MKKAFISAKIRSMKILLLISIILSSSYALAFKTPNQKLFEAVEENNFKKAANALLKGASPNAVNNSDAPTTTPFIRAAILNRVDIVDLLLKYHADINQARPIDQHTALMIASTRNYAALAELLIVRGAEINIETIFSRTALQIAALNNSLDVAKLLVLQPQIDINHRPDLCALAVASRQGFKEMVILIKEQTGSKAPSEECLQAAIGMAQYNHHQEILDILLN